MALLSAAPLIIPYPRRSNVKCAIFREERSNLNRTSFHHDHKPSNLNHSNFLRPLPQKLSPIISEGDAHFASLSRGEKTVCQVAGRPAWLDTAVPAPFRPYIMLARLDHDIGWWLQAWPAYWAIALATSRGAMPDLRLMALLGGVFLLMHTSCCTLNDLHDIKFDKQVERSKTRPLAADEVTPLQGWIFWVFQLFLMVPFVLPLNKLSMGLIAAQHVLWFIYPLMKRIIYVPQAFLAVTTNWSVLVGWAAAKGNFVDLGIILPVYIGSIFWCLAFDTIYAHQDKEDDAKAGVKSTALLFGNSTTYWNLAFTVISIGCFLLGGYNARLSWPFYAFMTAAAGQLLWQVLTVDLSSPFDCAMKFLSNKWFGGLVFAGMLLGRLV